MKSIIRTTLFTMFAGTMLAMSPGAHAQQQKEPDKPCMADAARLCPGVEPGGGKQIECLKEHMQEVSPACKKNLIQMKEKQEQKKQEQQPAPQPQP
jgi:hypothetical protein